MQKRKTQHGDGRLQGIFNLEILPFRQSAPFPQPAVMCSY